ncbi:hypothetical protein [Fluviicola chungangensis]|uniref:Uncharacterized protein n=1 Tax=Fluviicola chungangensis TaxID=2597671 RepID=A0A556N5U3_9FLAO|nr:hypothetical protein [Fluviicola chungangensis]TSJ47564.1 hypothetical protein FO442_00105 [Fluviicola chungangensis]
MKKIMFSAVVFLGASLSYGQNLNKDATKSATTQGPVVSKEMQAYAAKKGTYIIAKPQGKDLTPNGEISLEKAKLVDPAAMGIKITDRTQYYGITGTTDLLVVKSTWVLDNEMKTANK